MKRFRGESTFDASIAVDTSTRGDVTATIAVAVTRDEELEILNQIYQAAEEHGSKFIPFKSKSRHFDMEGDQDFLRDVIGRGKQVMSGYHFRHESVNRNQHYTEAVLSALLIDDLLSSLGDDVMILLDGDSRKVDSFAKACGGLNRDDVIIANCYKSEWYYPHSLLADLTAGCIAWRIDNDLYNYEKPILPVPPADSARQADWHRTFDYLRHKGKPCCHVRIPIDSVGAQAESDRARVWFDGLMARGIAETTPSSSLSLVVREVREKGYTELAERLACL